MLNKIIAEADKTPEKIASEIATHYNNNDLDALETVLRDAILLFPSDASLYFTLASILFEKNEQMTDFSELEDLLEQGLVLEPSDYSSRARLIAHYNREAKFDRVLALVNTALTLDFVMLLDELLQTKMTFTGEVSTKLEDLISNNVKINKANHINAIQLGYRLNILNLPQSAEKLLQTAINNGDQSFQVRSLLGESLFRQKKYQGALESFTKLLKLTQREEHIAMVELNIASMNLYLGNEKKSLAILDSVLKKGGQKAIPHVLKMIVSHFIDRSNPPILDKLFSLLTVFTADAKIKNLINIQESLIVGAKLHELSEFKISISSGIFDGNESYVALRETTSSFVKQIRQSISLTSEEKKQKIIKLTRPTFTIGRRDVKLAVY
jgi:tetratricopeptide (TPR) repeat protein